MLVSPLRRRDLEVGAWALASAIAGFTLWMFAQPATGAATGWPAPDATRITATNTTLYVTSSHGIYVVNSATGVITDTWTAFTDATDIAISSDDSTVYITRSSSGVSEIVGISTADSSNTTTWQAPDCQPVGIDIHVTTAYLACSNNRWVATQDLTGSSGSGFAHLTADYSADARTFSGIGVSPDGTRVYVATSSGFLAYDGSGSRVAVHQRGGVGASSMIFAKNLAWQINVGDNTVSGVDTANDNWMPRGALHFAAAEGTLFDAAWAPNGGKVFALLSGGIKTGTPATISGINDFGNKTTGIAETRTAVFYNYGSANARVTATPGLVNPNSAFQVVAYGCSNQIVAAGDTCTVSVMYTPTTGLDTATLTIWTNGNGEDGVRLYLYGTGTQAPNLEAFGRFDEWPVAVGTTHTETFTVQNTGYADLHVESATVTGTDAADYSIVTQTCNSVTLERLVDTCTVTVAMHPTALGTYARSAKLHIAADHAGIVGNAREYTLTAQVVGLSGGGLGSLAWGRDNAGQAACARTWPETVTSISAGWEGSAAVTSAGTLLTCGTTAGSFSSATNIVQAAGGGAAILRTDGTVEVGSLVAGHYEPPAELKDPTTAHVVAIAGFWAHVVALRGDGTVVSWGESAWGADQQIVPAEFADPSTAHVIAVDANAVATYALREDGSLVGWGAEDIPAELADPATAHVVDFSVAGGTMVAARDDGTVVAWGADCAAACRRFASNLTDVVRVAAGGTILLAQQRDGTLVSWDQYGNELPVPTGISNITQLAASPLGTFVVLRGVASKWRPGVLTAPRASRLLPGQTLADATLTGGQMVYRGTPVSGSFAFALPGTAPDTGTASQSVVFTPDNTDSYTSITLAVPVTVSEPWVVPGGTSIVTGPGGAWLYVSSANGIYKVRVSDGLVSDTWPTITDATDLDISSDGTKLYASRTAAYVSEIDEINTSTGVVTNTWSAPNCNPVGIDLRGTTAWVACKRGNTNRIASQDLTQSSGSGFSFLTSAFAQDWRGFRGITWNPEGTRIFVPANYGTLVFDANGTWLETATVRPLGQAYDVILGKGLAWIVTRDVMSLVGIDPSTDELQPRGLMRIPGSEWTLSDSDFSSDGNSVFSVVDGVIVRSPLVAIRGVDDFGSVVWDMPETQTATVHNYSDTAIAIETRTLGNNPYDAVWYIDNDTCVNSTLAAGGSCTFDVRYMANWDVQTYFSVSYDTADGLKLQLLTYGVAVRRANLTASADAVGENYASSTGPALVGGSARGSLVTVYNNGGMDLHIDSATVVDDVEGDFGITADGCSSKTISPSETCSVTVTFTPTSLGDITRTARLRFTSDTQYTPGTHSYFPMWGQVAGTAGDGPGVISWGVNMGALAQCARSFTDVVSVSVAWRGVAGVTRAGGVVACDLWAHQWDTYTGVVQTAGGGMGIVLADGSIRMAPALVQGSPLLAAPGILTDPATAHVRSLVCVQDHCAAVREDGTVMAWGDEFFGAGQTAIPPELQDSSTAHVTQVAIFAFPGLALHDDGTVSGWGTASAWSGTIPTALTDPAAAHVVELAAGDNFAFALRSDGTLVAWGAGCYSGCVTFAESLTAVAHIAAGQGFGYALLTDGSLVSWDRFGVAQAEPSGLRNISQIAMSAEQFVALSPWTPLARPAITAPTASTIYVGESLTASVLSGGSAMYDTVTVAGSFAFADPAYTPAFGSESVTVVFAPTDTNTYASAEVQVTIRVLKFTPIVTETPTASVVLVGQPLESSTLTGGVAKVRGVTISGSFAFADSSTVPGLGTAGQTVIFTPDDTDTYETITLQVPVTATRAALTIVETPTASGIWAGESLTASTLSGGAVEHNGVNVPGGFAFADTSTVPSAGTSSQRVIFTPTDTTHYDTATVQVSVVATRATTTVLYTGGLIVSIGARLPVSASTTSPIDCGSPVYVLTPSPLTGTDSLTITPVAGYVDTTNWREGVYQITVTYGAGSICTVSTDEATLTIAAPGAAATGAAKYTLSGIGRVSASFTVRAVPNTKPVQFKGQFILINNGKWRLKATVSTYVKSGSTGAISGTGTLQWWNQSANGGLGAWVVAAYNVSYTANFTATSKTSPGTFGIKITHTPTGGQPNKLPNSSPTAIKGGSISVA